MPEVTQPPNIGTMPVHEPGPTELLEDVADLSAGLGLGFMSFLGAIPGLLPCVALIVAALAVLAIPMVAVGLMAGVVYLLVRTIARIFRRAASVFRPAAPEPERPAPAVTAPDFGRQLPLKGPHAMV
jgi:hypothetical protein